MITSKTPWRGVIAGRPWRAVHKLQAPNYSKLIHALVAHEGHLSLDKSADMMERCWENVQLTTPMLLTLRYHWLVVVLQQLQMLLTCRLKGCVMVLQSGCLSVLSMTTAGAIVTCMIEF